MTAKSAVKMLTGMGSGLPSTLCGERTRSPQERNLIFPELRVSRRQSHTFHDRLSHEHAVERVAMKRRERGHRDGVLEAHRKKPERVSAEMLSQKGPKLAIRFETAMGHLDRELPRAGHAERDVVRGVGNRLASGDREPGIVSDPPQEGVSVQEELHFSKASRMVFGNGASKFREIRNRP